MQSLNNIKKILDKQMSEINPEYQSDTIENRVDYLIQAIEHNPKIKEVVKDNYLIHASEIFIKLVAKKNEQLILDDILYYSNNSIEKLGYKTNYQELMNTKKEVEKSNKKKFRIK